MSLNKKKKASLFTYLSGIETKKIILNKKVNEMPNALLLTSLFAWTLVCLKYKLDKNKLQNKFCPKVYLSSFNLLKIC